jgi:uncharacterized protein (DUF58 family)
MWYVGLGQGNGAAYLLFFLLLGVLAISVPKTFLNLTGLKVSAESAKPAFAGQEISLPLEIVNVSNRPRCALSAGLPDTGRESELMVEIPEGRASRTVIRFPVAKRGLHELTTVTLTSIWPLGFFKARRNTTISQHYLVYPKPAGDPKLPNSNKTGTGTPAEQIQPEGDDFAGVRAYLPGESQHHIDWKAVARGHPLMSKQFSTDGGGTLHLDFNSMAQPDTEARLSQLALWIIEAERTRRPYSLSLPSVEIPASIGEAHYHSCLRALACHR